MTEFNLWTIEDINKKMNENFEKHKSKGFVYASELFEGTPLEDIYRGNNTQGFNIFNDDTKVLSLKKQSI